MSPTPPSTFPPFAAYLATAGYDIKLLQDVTDYYIALLREHVFQEIDDMNEPLVYVEARDYLNGMNDLRIMLEVNRPVNRQLPVVASWYERAGTTGTDNPAKSKDQEPGASERKAPGAGAGAGVSDGTDHPQGRAGSTRAKRSPRKKAGTDTSGAAPKAGAGAH